MAKKEQDVREGGLEALVPRMLLVTEDVARGARTRASFTVDMNWIRISSEATGATSPAQTSHAISSVLLAAENQLTLGSRGAQLA